MAAGKKGYFKGNASVVGRMIAAGLVNAHEPVTFGKLAEIFDVSEGTDHGQGRRKELEVCFADHKARRQQIADAHGKTGKEAAKGPEQIDHSPEAKDEIK